MRAVTGKILIRAAVAAAVGASLLACTETVYKDFPGFAPPPTGAGEYLGYSTASTKTTTCGNCHASHQQLWITAKHSTAWSDLQASGHANSTCNACHSTNSWGNDTNTVATGGYIGSANERYQDVQCESCHGPGQNHVNNPENAANQPIPSLWVAIGVTTSCSGCHTGTHEPFVEDWSKSPHGAFPHWAIPAGSSSYLTGTTCSKCHSGQNALKLNFGVTNTVYKEMNNPLTVAAGLGPNGILPIVCGVCHDPHGSDNIGQTRLPVNGTDVETNLCARCHNRRAVPDTSSNSGPHAPEGALVTGDNNVGWRPPLMIAAGASGVIFGSHGDTAINHALCATCHIVRVSEFDSATQTTDYSTGHLFLAIPCKNAVGIPDSVSTCALNATERVFGACASSGCHGSDVTASNLLSTEILTINNLLAQLKPLLENTAKIPCSAYAVNKPLNTARGARFNYLLASEAAVSGADATCGNNRNIPLPVAKPSAAAHNIPLIEQLLQYSILQVQQDYP